MSIATLDAELQALKTERETLIGERSEFTFLTYDIKKIYKWIKSGITEMNLIEERDEEGNLISTNEQDVLLWDSQDVIFGMYLAYFKLTKLEFIKEIVRESDAFHGRNPFVKMEQAQDSIIRQLTGNISIKDTEISNKRSKLIKAMAIYHNINID